VSFCKWGFAEIFQRPAALFDRQSMQWSVIADTDYIHWGADQAMMRSKKD
jgi:hypothetical protein